MSTDVRFELLTRAEVDDRLIDEMLALLGRAFGRWPSLDPEVPLGDHLRWKMESPGAPYAAIVGRVGPRLVVARLVVGQGVRVRGASRTALFTPDLAVDPEFQGRGISIACSAWRDAQLTAFSDLEIDDSNNPRMVSRRRGRGDTPIANQLRALYLVRSPARVPRTVVGRMHVPLPVLRLVLHGAAAAARCRAALRSSPPLAQPPYTVARFDQRADSFFERAAAPFDFIYDADQRRLNWRYCDRRAGPFVARIVEDGEGIAGYAVHRIGRPQGHLVDLLALPGRDDIVEALARDAVERLVERGAAVVTCWLPDRHPYRRVLRRLGFVTSPRPLPRRYRAQRLPAADLAFLERPEARLHLVMGSGDLV